MSGTILQLAKRALCTLAVGVAWAHAQDIPRPTPGPSNRTVIAASMLLDGRGHVLHDTRIVIEGAKIVAIGPKAGSVNYDLRGLTVLPGWIDAHAHIAWSFGKNGKNAGPAGTDREAAYQAASNAWTTLIAGFTTIQSLGSPADVPLRDAIASGSLPGPRILTAVEPLMGQGEKTGTPDEIRAFVQKQKEAGADVIKIFANYSVRQPAMRLSQGQLSAACGEVKKPGLRSLVHAYSDAVRTATLAGCRPSVRRHLVCRFSIGASRPGVFTVLSEARCNMDVRVNPARQYRQAAKIVILRSLLWGRSPQSSNPRSQYGCRAARLTSAIQQHARGNDRAIALA